MVAVKQDLEGQLQWNGKAYDMRYNAATGIVELTPMDGSGTAIRTVSSGPKTAPPEQMPGNGRGASDKQQQPPADVLKEFGNLKLSIQNILKQNRAQKMQQNQIKGKLGLKSRSLTKSQTGSKSIYAKKSKTNAYGYNIILLVDNSGSMMGDKIQLANEVARGLHTTLRGTDGINTKVLAFTDSLRTVAKWDDVQVSPMSAGGGNCDAAACYVTITEQFRDTPNPEYKNILLVLSDGEPCDGRLGRSDLPDLEVFDTEDTASIAKFVAHTAAANHVYVAGLGIIYNSTQIPNSREVKELKDVQKVMVQILKGAIDHE